jgi:hypothetical protein
MINDNAIQTHIILAKIKLKSKISSSFFKEMYTYVKINGIGENMRFL